MIYLLTCFYLYAVFFFITCALSRCNLYARCIFNVKHGMDMSIFFFKQGT